MKSGFRFFLCGCLPGCIMFALGFFCCVAFCFLFVACSIFHGFSQTDVRYGSVDEVLWSTENFYTIRGDRDYSRMPLRFPYSLLQLERDGSIALCNRNQVLLGNVAMIGYQSGYFAGVDFNLEASAQQEERWFLITPENECLFFETCVAFSDALRIHNLPAFRLYPTTQQLHTFGKTGSCLPLFRLEELREQTNNGPKI